MKMPSRIRSLERHRADLPHLLHPSYLQSSQSSSGSPSSSGFSSKHASSSNDYQLPSPAKVYVDSFGTMHDPDYQLFPRDEWRSLEESRRGEGKGRYGYGGKRQSATVFGGSARDGYDIDEDDSEYDEEAHDEFWMSSPSSSFSTPPPHHSQRVRRLTSSSYTSSSASSYSYNNQSQYYSPTSSLVRTSTAATTTAPVSGDYSMFYPRDEEILSALASASASSTGPSNTHPSQSAKHHRRRNVLYKHLPSRRHSTTANVAETTTVISSTKSHRRRRRLSRQKQRWYEDDASPFTDEQFQDEEGDLEEEGSVYSADDEHDILSARRASLDSHLSQSQSTSHQFSIFSKRVPPTIDTSSTPRSLIISAPRSAIPASEMEMQMALDMDMDEGDISTPPLEESHTYSMKRKWTALQLRVGFALFRTRRRLSRRLSLT